MATYRTSLIEFELFYTSSHSYCKNVLHSEPSFNMFLKSAEFSFLSSLLKKYSFVLLLSFSKLNSNFNMLETDVVFIAIIDKANFTLSLSLRQNKNVIMSAKPVL